MNADETSKVLSMIATHYWQAANHLGDRNVDLMVETWTMALADVPLTPYIANALEWWFKHEAWPPQASQLRERAITAMRQDQRDRDAHDRWRAIAHAPARQYDTSLPGLIHEWNQRRKAGQPEGAPDA